MLKNLFAGMGYLIGLAVFSAGAFTIYGHVLELDFLPALPLPEKNVDATQGSRYDLNTDLFTRYPHPAFNATTQKAFPPIDLSFLRDRKKAEREPGWLRALRSRLTYLDEFIKAANDYNVPLLLLLAIAEQESGFHPWALNIGGQPFKPKSREDAMMKLKAHYRPSYDVGLMQVNSYWMRRFELHPHDAFEPAINIVLGAYILNECFHAYGANWQALGAYHHPPNRNTARSLNYAKSIWGRYLRLQDWKNKYKEPKK
jgi:hypothetical protein